MNLETVAVDLLSSGALNGSLSQEPGDNPAAAAADGYLIDAYSRAVIAAVDRVSPSVVNIEVHQAAGKTRSGEPRERRGGGAGVWFCAHGLVVTESTAVRGAQP